MKLSLISKLKFYLALAYYKLISPLECDNLRLKIFVKEFAFLLAMLGLRSLKSEDDRHITLKTKFGNYRIRNIDVDFAIASPSFERLDMNKLLTRINNSLVFGRKVVFVDIGASFGKYTIAVATYFRSYVGKLSIYAFEPEPESYKLLKENVLINRLKNVKTFRVV